MTPSDSHPHDFSRPTLLIPPIEDPLTFVGHTLAGSIDRFALSVAVSRAADWHEADVAFITQGRSWDPLYYGRHWHRADWLARFIREFLADCPSPAELVLLAPLSDFSAEDLFSLLNDSIYSEADWWSAPTERLGIPANDIEAWQKSIQALGNRLRVLHYISDIPTLYVWPTLHADRLIFRDQTTSTIHELRLLPGELAATLRRLADSLDKLLHTSAGQVRVSVPGQ